MAETGSPYFPPLQLIPRGAADADVSVAKNTALAFATQIVTAALTALLTLYLTRKLGPRSFGEFSLAVGVAGVLLVVADGGLAASSGRFLAEHRHDSREVSSIMRSAMTLKLVLAFVASIALFALAVPLAHAYGDGGLVWPFRAVAIVLFTQSVMAQYSVALVSVQRISANLRMYTVESFAETLASIALVALGGGAGGATFGRAIGYTVGALAGVVLSARIFGRRTLYPVRPERAVVAPIIRYAGTMFVVGGAYTLFSQIDVLLIGAFAGSAQVGLFSAPMRLCAALHYPGLAVSNSVAPRLARSAGREPDVRSFQVALRYLVVLQAAMVAPVVVWASPIIHLLLGSQFAKSAEVLQLLAPFVFLVGLGPLVSVSVNYLGESRLRIRIALAAFLIDLLLDVLLIPSMGALGGAIATSVAYAVYVPAHLLLCRRLLGMSLGPLALTTARSLVAAAGAGAMLLLAGTSATLSLTSWVFGAASAGAVFVVLLIVTGEFSVAEIAGAGGRAARRVAALAQRW